MRTQEMIRPTTRLPLKRSKISDPTSSSGSIDGYILFLIFLIGILGATYILSWSSPQNSPFTSQGYVLEHFEG